MDILLGLQWGDEGKGKVVDFLTPQYEVIVRFQGGPNAGHTLIFDGHKMVLHQVPSGIFRDGSQNVIGNGVVLDPIVLQKELTQIRSLGVAVEERLLVSKKAHLIMPTHRLLDAASEKSKGDDKIGSTLRGIGPTYQSKVGRSGIRVCDIFLPDFMQRYRTQVAKHLEVLEQLSFTDFNLEEMEAPFFAAIEKLKELQVIDSEYFLNKALAQGQRILAEGAQGTLLDIDFGSYPFVTSSNTSAAGACTGSGVPPRSIGEVFGIFKAYCTRVGNGPFPTELEDETGHILRRIGSEFGATTGRPRRCGWLDLPALKYAVMINGVTQLFMMKADVLNTFTEIKICTHYIIDGQETDVIPYDVATQVTPQYVSMPGWNTEVLQNTAFEDLPKALAEYIVFIEQYIGVPITLVSYGPDRNQTILRQPSLA
jgi:adenylosuccinate synthase